MTIQEIGNGSFLSEQFFESEEEAKEYLTKRAEMYYDEFEGQVDEHIATIENNGYLEIDRTMAKIVELQTETKFICSWETNGRTRYINQFDEKNGTSNENSAMTFDTREEAEKFIEEKGYTSCGVSEIEVYIEN